MPNRRAGETDESVAILAHLPGHYLVAVWRNVSLVYWMREGSVEAVAQIRAALDPTYAQAAAHSFSTIHLVRDGAGLPEADVRSALLAMSSHFAPHTACVGIVLMGAGFWASALQSVLTALRMLVPQRSAMMRFSREPAELCEWFPVEHTQRTRVYVDRAGLADALQRVLTAGATQS